MTIGKYLLRGVKYLIKLAVLLALIFAVMHRSGTSNIAAEGGLGAFFEAFFASTRGRIFIAAIVAWCLVYPAVEFKKRLLPFSMARHKAVIIKALHAGGMTLVRESDDRMVFVGSLALRIWWLGEDTVTVTADDAGGFEIEGPRRMVFDAERRFLATMGDENNHRDQTGNNA